MALLPVLAFIAAAGLSCSLTPAPYPSAIGDVEPGALPQDPAAVRLMAEELLESGDLAAADSVITKALERDLPPQEENALRSLRQRVRLAQFQRECPLRLEIWTPKKSLGFDEALDVEFRIHNLSSSSVRIPSGGGFWSWLPFTEARKSVIHAEVSVINVPSSGGTVTGGSWNEIIDIPRTLSLESGAVAALPLKLEPAHQGGLIFRHLTIEAELIPGGLETDEYDFGMLRFCFEALTVQIFQEDDERPEVCKSEDLREAIDTGSGRSLFLTAVLLGDDERWLGVDALVNALESLSGSSRRLAMTALAVLSGRELVFEPYRWIEWWQEERSQHLPPETGTGLLHRANVPGHARSVPGHVWSIPGHARSVPGHAWSVAGHVVRLLACLGSPGADPMPSVIQRSVGQAGSGTTAHGAGRMDKEGDPVRSSLADGYFGRRFTAVKGLAGEKEDILPRLAELTRDPRPLVRRGCVAALEEIGGPGAQKLIEDAFRVEGDRAARQAMIQALARLEAAFPMLPREISAADRFILEEIYLETRLVAAMEGVMHEGAIPGFYDGQFAPFWEISLGQNGEEDRGCYDLLVRIANDPDYQYVPRVLAIMSLSEKKAPDMEESLRSLIIPPRTELMREWAVFFDLRNSNSLSEEMIQEGRALQLSGYARYSLAKAGNDRYVLAKVAELKRWIGERKALIDERGMFRDIFGRRRLEQEFSRSIYFDIGYEYQQLDDFANAEIWYQRLIKNFPDSSAVSNAHYNLACLYSLQKETSLALHHLSRSIEKGFLDFAWMEKDRDLDNVRMLPEFAELKRSVLSAPDGDDDDKQ